MNERERKSKALWEDLRAYWHLYVALAATGVLTVFAGVYLGLAPTADGAIEFADAWDAVRRIFFATYFGVTFFVVAEGAVLYSKNRLLARDVDEEGEDSGAQRLSMGAMLVVSVLAVVITSVAAGQILASWLGALDKWLEIPAFAQAWVVVAPPILLVFYAVMSLVYQQASHRAKLERDIDRSKRQAEAEAYTAFANAYKEQYRAAAPSAARRAAVANAQRDAEKWAGKAAAGSVSEAGGSVGNVLEAGSGYEAPLAAPPPFTRPPHR